MYIEPVTHKILLINRYCAVVQPVLLFSIGFYRAVLKGLLAMQRLQQHLTVLDGRLQCSAEEWRMMTLTRSDI